MLEARRTLQAVGLIESPAPFERHTVVMNNLLNEGEQTCLSETIRADRIRPRRDASSWRFGVHPPLKKSVGHS